MDQFQAIRVFARVVESGNFTRASDSLNMPKATVTKLVQGLESHLRVKLLNRTTRRVTVTPDGAAYYERTRRLMNELEDIEATLGNAQTAPKGSLRVDVGASLARLVLIPALPAFHQRYPDVPIDLGVTDRPVDLIGDNVDCVIRGGALTDLSLVARLVGKLKFVTCATPAYLERHGTPTHPRDIEAGHQVATYLSARTGRPTPLLFERDGEQIEVAGRYVVGVNESNAHLAAGLAGLGLLQTLAFMAGPHIERGELVPVLTDWRRSPNPLYVVYPPNRHLSAKVRVFVDWVAELFSGTRR